MSGRWLDPAPEVRATLALVRANALYWPAVLPRVHRELSRWKAHAWDIPDPTLRAQAIAKLEDESFNTEVAATLATLVPRRQRSRVIAVTVALQVMYDYLDGLSEQPARDSLGNSRTLFGAFEVAFATERVEPTDYYRRHPQSDDNGYLEALVETCQDAFRGLPRAVAVAPVARGAAMRCGEAQGRTHAIPSSGVDQLAAWATSGARDTGLTWWEYAAGATASVLALHALIAAAADPRTTPAEARDLDAAYLFIAAISTLLDSLVDHHLDVEDGSHSFISYYESEGEKVERIGALAIRAVTDARRLRNGPHHHMTTAGVAAYYLSAPAARKPSARAVRAGVVGELRPLITPILGVFRLWRLAKVGAAAWR
jgi:tetraprenyl-beta-curcumene synthase